MDCGRHGQSTKSSTQIDMYISCKCVCPVQVRQTSGRSPRNGKNPWPVIRAKFRSEIMWLRVSGSNRRAAAAAGPNRCYVKILHTILLYIRHSDRRDFGSLG
ncbi:hypothetical protein QTP88_008478 [Uroleucon formosanum]